MAAEVEPELRRWVERVVPDTLGTAARVVDVAERRAPGSSWYRTSILRVALSGGEQLELFLKDFGAYERPKDAMAGRRAREVRVYRELLASKGLGTALFFGYLDDPRAGRHWLLLERVEGAPVAYCRFERWVEAAAWLGRLHGEFAPRADELGRVAELLRHDESFFQERAAAAIAAVASSPRLAERLAPAVELQRETAELAAGLPRTLVHGAFRPAEILVSDDGSGRVCPVDWEQAALGSALYDLAFLSDGFAPAERDILVRAYREEALRRGAPVPREREIARATAGFQLHRVLTWIGRSAERDETPQTVEKLVARAEAILRLEP